MTKTFASALPPSPAPLPVPALCRCVHFLSEECLAERWDIGMDLAQILHGCSCTCHVAANGAYMPAGAWAANRKQKQRDIARVQALNESRMQQSKKEID